jgi:hypothetical protein
LLHQGCKGLISLLRVCPRSILDGLYLLLAGISFVFTTAATLSFALAHPFPFFSLTYG